ncbi:zinc-finger domain-containing protein [Tuberibacillus sp. Marseille-P3662]|uniref:zinc-finger domain-containing protein n=1 Tax=Tuberibacillus sp. Marseille-P3662 TaxID=1965358 RepID=UPI000A1CDF25|nr:zinc-finger domain-containing protein [Tuberibacillus sp. Marseille-P3662]
MNAERHATIIQIRKLEDQYCDHCEKKSGISGRTGYLDVCLKCPIGKRINDLGKNLDNKQPKKKKHKKKINKVDDADLMRLHYEGMIPKEIAEQLGCTIQTVYWKKSQMGLTRKRAIK